MQVLEDVHLAPMDQAVAADIAWLQEFLEVYSSALAYDGRQFYSLLSDPLVSKSTSSQLSIRWTQLAHNPPVSCLKILPPPVIASRNKSESEFHDFYFILLFCVSLCFFLFTREVFRTLASFVF